MASDPISVVNAVPAESDGAASVGARFTESVLRERYAVPLQGSVALAAPLAPSPPTASARPFEASQGKPWALPAAGLAVFYGRPETPRLFHYFLPRLLGEGKRVLCLDGANRFDPLLIARLARQRGMEAAEFNRGIRVARAFTCFQLTELLVRVPRFMETFAADALIVTALPDLYLDQDIRDRDAAVAFCHALDALRALGPLPLGVAVFSDAASFEALRPRLSGPRHGQLGPHSGELGPRRAMFTQLAAQANELWRFALDGENGNLRLIGEKNCSPPSRQGREGGLQQSRCLPAGTGCR
jgi:hypothetical protein